MLRRMHERRWVARAALAVALLVARPMGADEPPGRELLATGDTIPGLGRIGELGAGVRGITDDGAVLLDLSLTDRTRGLAWADPDGLRFVWRAADGAGGPVIAGRTAAASADGHWVLAAGDPDSTGRLTALYAIADGEVRRLLASGDRTAEGWTVAGFQQRGVVANDGSAAVMAILTSPAGEGSYLLSLSSAGVRIIAGASPLPEPSPALAASSIELLAALPGGGAVFQARIDADATAIFRGGPDHLETLLSSAAPGPDGETLSFVHAVGASSDGEVLVYACAVDAPTDAFEQRICPIYRSRRGGWITVRQSSDRGPDGRPTLTFGGALNARGDVVFAAGAYRSDRFIDPLVLYYPANGAARIIAADAFNPLGMNNRGQVALQDTQGVRRWTDGAVAMLVSPRTAVAGGARPLAGGILLWCQADDGRVGAYAVIDGERGAWLCLDDLGPHIMQRHALGGGACAFSDTAMLGSDAGHLTRSDGRRTSELLAVGARLGGGRRIDYIRSFATNPRGTVAALVDSGPDHLLVRLQPGGDPQVLDATAGSTPEVLQPVAVGVAADGTIAVLAFLGNSPTPAVVAVTPAGTVSMPFRDGTPGSRVVGFSMVGNDLLLALDYYQAPPEMRLIDLATGESTERLPPGAVASGELWEVLDTSLTNDVLYTTFGDSGQYWLLAGDEVRPIPVAGQEAPRPVTVDATGGLLFATDTYTVGAARTVLSSTSAHIAGRCVAPAATSPADGDGCAIAGDPTTRPWPLLGALAGAALALCGRRRGAPRSYASSPTGSSGGARPPAPPPPSGVSRQR